MIINFSMEHFNMAEEKTDIELVSALVDEITEDEKDAVDAVIEEAKKPPAKKKRAPRKKRVSKKKTIVKKENVGDKFNKEVGDVYKNIDATGVYAKKAKKYFGIIQITNKELDIEQDIINKDYDLIIKKISEYSEKK